MSLDNLEAQARKVWEATELEQAKVACKQLIRDFKAQSKAEMYEEVVDQIKTLKKVQSFATDLYMQGFSNTSGLSKRV